METQIMHEKPEHRESLWDKIVINIVTLYHQLRYHLLFRWLGWEHMQPCIICGWVDNYHGDNVVLDCGHAMCESCLLEGMTEEHNPHLCGGKR